MLLARESVNSGLLFDLVSLNQEIKTLSEKSEEANFWDNRNSALETINRLNHIKEIVETYTDLTTKLKDLEELLSFEDDSFLEQIVQIITHHTRTGTNVKICFKLFMDPIF